MNLLSIKKEFEEVTIAKEGFFSILGLIDSRHDSDVKMLTYLESNKYVKEFLENQGISCAICTEDLVERIINKKEIGVCICRNPKEIFYKFHNYLGTRTTFYSEPYKSRISKSAKVHPTSSISDQNVIIGDNTIIGPHAVILPNVEIDDNVFIGAGSVIGGDGFQYIKSNNQIISVVHSGKVKIHSNVEIHSNCCIDKGVFGDTTEIGEFTKIDNLVQIAHCAKIGRRTLIAANTTVGGSTRIGDDAWIGLGAVISNSLVIGNGVRVSLGSVVVRNLEDKEYVSGNFAINHQEFIINNIRALKAKRNN